CQQGNTNPFTF
nr:immunoglobulin light chain junction region [Macaca mulatta]MOW09732.1 immunoglobulin light chain junction region [Macaca mulatta]MOW10719.1 immunoglobulin light chain junction region [Macaca mulatta]